MENKCAAINFYFLFSSKKEIIATEWNVGTSLVRTVFSVVPRRRVHSSRGVSFIDFASLEGTKENGRGEKKISDCLSNPIPLTLSFALRKIRKREPPKRTETEFRYENGKMEVAANSKRRVADIAKFSE